MFDIGWPELMIVMIVALIVIGPKDLPKALRQLGKWVGAARRMSSEFHKHVDDIVRETELEDVKRGIDKARSVNIKRELEKQIDPDGSLTQAFNGSTSKKVTGSNRSWNAAAGSAAEGSETAGAGKTPAPRPRSTAVSTSVGGSGASQKADGNGISNSTTAQALTDATARSPGLADHSAGTVSKPAASAPSSPQNPSVEPDKSATTDKA